MPNDEAPKGMHITFKRPFGPDVEVRLVDDQPVSSDWLGEFCKVASESDKIVPLMFVAGAAFDPYR
jgi:hypothetical protein